MELRTTVGRFSLWTSYVGGKQTVFLASVYVLWLIVNVPPWQFYGNNSIALMIFNWGTTGIFATNSIFPLTYGAAVFTLIFSFVRFRKNVKLGWIKSLLFALTTPFAFTSTFEGVYQNVAYVARPGMLHINMPGELLLASWVLLGFGSAFFWKLSRKFWVLLMLDAAGFLIWVLIGYPQIYEVNSLTVFALVLNLETKLTFALTFLVLISEGTRTEQNRIISGNDVEPE
jgi:hypothetical protein